MWRKLFHTQCSLIEQEDAGDFSQIGCMPLPVLYAPCFDELSFARNVGGNAKFRLRTAILKNIVQHLIVTIRCLNEQLCLMLGLDTLFELLQLLGTFDWFNRQVSVEGKALPVETRTHD